LGYNKRGGGKFGKRRAIKPGAESGFQLFSFTQEPTFTHVRDEENPHARGSESGGKAGGGGKSIFHHRGHRAAQSIHVNNP